ncbi:MAG: phage portal protein, partial [bacterium]|nr:phage portal protein [bacterium]
MGSFTKWLSGLFGAARAEEIEENGYRLEEADTPLQLERMAIQSAVGLISAAVGQCRFRTFLEGEEKQLEEYYLWNYSPNANQSSTQFLQDFVETLVYNNEALIVERRGELFLAESFSYQEEGTKELTFTNITVGSESIPDKKAGSVLFFRLGNTDIRPMLSNLCHQYELLIQKAVNSYERGAADKGILNIDTLKRGKIENEEQYRKDLLDGRFKKFFSSQNAVLPLYEGYTYTPHKRELRNTSELNDVKNMSDEVYNRVGQAFRIPPAFLRGETAQSGDGMDQFIRMCV